MTLIIKMTVYDYVVIRGPISVGKTIIGKLLTSKLCERGYSAELFSFDEIRGKYGIKLPTDRNKAKGIVPLTRGANQAISNNVFPVIEGVFYEKDFLDIIQKGLQGRGIYFKLFAPLNTCLQRNSQREQPREISRCSRVWQLHDEQKIAGEFVIQTENRKPNEIVNNLISKLIVT